MKYAVALLVAGASANGHQNPEYDKLSWSNPLRTFDNGPMLEIAPNQSNNHGANGFKGRVSHLEKDMWFGVLWNRYDQPEDKRKQDYWYFKANNNGDNCMEVQDKWSDRIENQWKDGLNGDNNQFDNRKSGAVMEKDDDDHEDDNNNASENGEENKEEPHKTCMLLFDKRYDTGESEDLKVDCSEGAEEGPAEIPGMWFVGWKDNNNMTHTGNFTAKFGQSCNTLVFAGAQSLALTAGAALAVSALYM